MCLSPHPHHSAEIKLNLFFSFYLFSLVLLFLFVKIFCQIDSNYMVFNNNFLYITGFILLKG